MYHRKYLLKSSTIYLCSIKFIALWSKRLRLVVNIWNVRCKCTTYPKYAKLCTKLVIPWTSIKPDLLDLNLWISVMHYPLFFFHNYSDGNLLSLSFARVAIFASMLQEGLGHAFWTGNFFIKKIIFVLICVELDTVINYLFDAFYLLF